MVDSYIATGVLKARTPISTSVPGVAEGGYALVRYLPKRRVSSHLRT